MHMYLNTHTLPYETLYISKPFYITKASPLFLLPILTGFKEQEAFHKLSFSLRMNCNFFS